MTGLLDALLGCFRWYRRLRKGHWECWIFWGTHGPLAWVRNEHGTRPHDAFGTPLCEDYPRPPVPRISAGVYR